MFKNFKMMLHGMSLHSLNSFRVEVMSCNPGKFSCVILWWFSPQIFPCSFEIYFIWMLYLTYWSSNFLAFSFLFPFFFFFLHFVLLLGEVSFFNFNSSSEFKFRPLKSFWCLIVSLKRIIFYSPCCLRFSMRAREAHRGRELVVPPSSCLSPSPLSGPAVLSAAPQEGAGHHLAVHPGIGKGWQMPTCLDFTSAASYLLPSWVPSACQLSLSHFSFCV